MIPSYRVLSRLGSPRTIRLAALAGVLGTSAAVFWRTAYPTITWWDSSSYSLAAATLGIASAPGSLLLTLLGWPLTKLPGSIETAHRLNLFAGLLAAIAVGMVYLAALRVLGIAGETDSDDAGNATSIGVALGALSFAFSTTLWDHAVKFTPYVLTAVFTGLILWTMVRWWEKADDRQAWQWLALLALLFGLDFSVHRTNALMIPGVIAWILIRHPRTALSPRAWLAGAVGMMAGLSVQLLVIPIAARTRSPMSMLDPSNLTRFWQYVSLANRGGGFLIDLWPRKSGLLSVQLADFLRVFGNNFGWLPAVALLVGFIALYRRARRLAVALTIVIGLQAATTVTYFNIPANYFRTFDRHYLPVFLTVAVILACGMGVIVRHVVALAANRRWVPAGVGVLLAASIPVAQLVGNWSKNDASHRFFARDYAENALRELPLNAIHFTVGDNDTFPLWYLQAVEGVRPDVCVLNLNLMNDSLFIDRLQRMDPSFPFALTSRERATAIGAWKDTTIEVAVSGTAEQLGLAGAAKAPDTITMRPRRLADPDLQLSDVVLLDIIRTNQWRRPLTFAITTGDIGWLQSYGRLEGMYRRIRPVVGLGADRESLRANLLTRYGYRGYADPAIQIDDATRSMGYQYLMALDGLVDAEMAVHDTARCRAVATRVLAAVPPERLGIPAQFRLQIEARCSRG